MEELIWSTLITSYKNICTSEGPVWGSSDSFIALAIVYACVTWFVFGTGCVRKLEVLQKLKSCGIGCIKVYFWHTRTSNWRDAHALPASTVTHRFFELSLSEDAIPIVDDLNSFVVNSGRYIMQNSTIKFFSPNYLKKTILLQVAECISRAVSVEAAPCSGNFYHDHLQTIARLGNSKNVNIRTHWVGHRARKVQPPMSMRKCKIRLG